MLSKLRIFGARNPRMGFHLIVILAVCIILSAGALPILFDEQGNIALLDSQNTREFCDRHYPGCDMENHVYYLGADEYQRYFRGWQLVLDELKEKNPDGDYSYDIIHDQDITAKGLAGYKLLILSNNAMLTDDQTKAVQQWVLRGGRLLATFGSGYKEETPDPRQIDMLKAQEGGTFGLHQLWHDPIGKLFSSMNIDPRHPGVDEVLITRYEGPTKDLDAARASQNRLAYGGLANILIQRPINHPNVLAFLVIDNQAWKSTTPAVISTRQSKGLVVYFAFAPEFLVYYVAEVAGNPLPDGSPARCAEPDPNSLWPGRDLDSRTLMISTLNYLLAN